MEKIDSTVLTSFNSALHKLTGHKRRLYAAELANTYYDGSARKTERSLGVSREVVTLGLKEMETGIRCMENFSSRGRKKRNRIREFKHGYRRNCCSTYAIRPLPQ